MIRTVCVILLPFLVLSHFSLTYPPNRAGGDMATAGFCAGKNPDETPQNGTCLWFNDGCLIGCERCDGGGETQGMAGCDNETSIIKPTLPKKYLTYPNVTYIDQNGTEVDMSDYVKHNPWYAPGRAPVLSSCGLAGGYHWAKNGFPGNGGYPPQGVQHGVDGRYMPESKVTVWPQGSEQQVAISVNANHGGGYSYRLCPKPGDYEMLTEECFQANTLDFVGDKQWVQWGDDESRKYEIEAVRVTEGTYPEGSMWTRFPMPGCGGFGGGDAGGGSDVPGRVQATSECDVTQFDPPLPSLFGYGLTQCVYPGLMIPLGGLRPNTRPCTASEYEDVKELFNVNFIDLVKVPEDLKPGRYVMSWRHDCEQTPQVWTTCADILVTPGGVRNTDRADKNSKDTLKNHRKI